MWPKLSVAMHASPTKTAYIITSGRRRGGFLTLPTNPPRKINVRGQCSSAASSSWPNIVWSTKPTGQHNKLTKNPQEPQRLASWCGCLVRVLSLVLVVGRAKMTGPASVSSIRPDGAVTEARTIITTASQPSKLRTETCTFEFYLSVLVFEFYSKNVLS